MPRLSREAVAAREKLARELFSQGKSQYQVQQAMEAFDVGGGKTGYKMAPPRLAEIEAEVKGGTAPKLVAQVKQAGLSVDMTKVRELEEHAEKNCALVPGYDTPKFRDGSISVKRCTLDTRYRETVDVSDPTSNRSVCLEGRFIGEDAGLFCFRMDDGRTFKKWHNERMLEVSEDTGKEVGGASIAA